VHPPLHTVEDSKRLRGTIPCSHIKNLVLRDSKAAIFLVSVLEDRNLDLKALRRHIGASSNLSFVRPEVLRASLRTEPGSVSPLSLLNDADRSVSFYLDSAILQHERVNVLALRPDMTLSLRPRQLIEFLETDGRKIGLFEPGS
jgi:Ala-tRNA(Pro) deacylase